jgi:hypothetical protein
LNSGAAGPLALIEECRDGDGRQNPDDDHDDQQLNERETIIAVIETFADCEEQHAPPGARFTLQDVKVIGNAVTPAACTFRSIQSSATVLT